MLAPTGRPSPCPYPMWLITALEIRPELSTSRLTCLNPGRYGRAVRAVSVNVAVHEPETLFCVYQVWLSRYAVTSTPTSMQPSSLTSSTRVIGSVTAPSPDAETCTYEPLACPRKTL